MAKQVFTFEATGWDKFDRRENTPADGTRVVLTSVFGAPKNGTMGHVFVADAASGQFIGLVSKASLRKAVR